MKTLVILAPPEVEAVSPDSVPWTAGMAKVFRNQPFMRIACDPELRPIKDPLFGERPASDLPAQQDLRQTLADFVLGFAGGNGVLIVTRKSFNACLKHALDGDGLTTMPASVSSHSDSEPACVAIQFGLRGEPERIAKISPTYTLASFANGVVYEQMSLNFHGD